MLDIDYLFSEDKDVIIAVLVSQIRDQTCDLERLTEEAESSELELKSARCIIDRLEAELAAAKKAARVVKAANGEAPAPKKKGGRPKKAAVAPVKRGRGRPKKAVA
jgi:hypothetical protein